VSVTDLTTNFNDGTTQSWTALGNTSISNSNNTLKIKKGGGNGVVGVSNSFSATSGTAYNFSMRLDENACHNAVLIEIKDAGGTVIVTQTIGTTNGFMSINQPFTAPSTGTYTFTIKRTGGNGGCTFFIDDVLITHQNSVITTLCDSYNYKYGFNGMESDDEVKGSKNSYTSEWRQYDPRLGRWLSPDPAMRKYAGWSPYAFAFNNPIKVTDPNGDDPNKRQTRKLNRKINRFGKKVDKLVSSGTKREDAIDLVAKKLGNRNLYQTNERGDKNGRPYKTYNIADEYEAQTEPKIEFKRVSEPVEPFNTKWASTEMNSYKTTEGIPVTITIENITQQKANAPQNVDVITTSKRGGDSYLARGEAIANGSSKSYPIPQETTVITIITVQSVNGSTQAAKYRVSYQYDKKVSTSYKSAFPYSTGGKHTKSEAVQYGNFRH